MLASVHRRLAITTMIACIERIESEKKKLEESLPKYSIAHVHGGSCIHNFNDISSIYWNIREEMNMITKQMDIIDKIKEIRDETQIEFDENDNVVYL